MDNCGSSVATLVRIAAEPGLKGQMHGVSTPGRSLSAAFYEVEFVKLQEMVRVEQTDWIAGCSD